MLKLIMPMAGMGSRFEDAGYTTSKPMIDVNGIPMFVHAERCIGLGFDERIFIVRKEQQLKESILEWYPDAIVHELDGLTEGTACTILSVQEYISPYDSVFVSNCDQHTEWEDIETVRSAVFDKTVDGLISVFACPEKDPKWSYAEIDGALNFNTASITRVAEKDPISQWATTGWYYWRRWGVFKESAEAMIAADDRVNNEFYTCPVFNYSIKTNKRIIPMAVSNMIGLGTPEELEAYLQDTDN